MLPEKLEVRNPKLEDVRLDLDRQRQSRGGRVLFELRTSNFELWRRPSLPLGVLTALLLSLAGCTGDFANLFASLGGDTVGGRGRVQVLFLNNTPYRAVLTFGTYDQTDPTFAPDFRQFTVDNTDLELGPDGASGIGLLDCARVFSIGGSRLLTLIAAGTDSATASPSALVHGVEFFEIPEDTDPTDDVTPDPISHGLAAPFEALLGVDFPCGALLIVNLELNDAGPQPFRVDFRVIPSHSSR